LPRGETLYCEMCGAPIGGRPYRAIVDGVEMILCVSCYLKLVQSGRARPAPERRQPPRRQPRRQTRRKPSIELYDIVEDYGERIAGARESRGWTRAALAQKLRISETMLRKIEQGKMKPSIDLARRIEKLLGIQLLEPVEIEDEDYSPAPGTLTLGDVVVVKKDEDEY